MTVLVLTLCVATGAAHAAVADYLGKPVASVQLVVEGRETTDPALMQVVQTVVGRPLSMADVRETITHLFSLGRFDDVRADATLAGDGVALRYELSPVHHVVDIRFAGNLRAPGVDVGRLRRAVVERFGQSPPLGRSGEVARLVGDSLRQRGYLKATVTPRADLQHAPERATLVLTIDPGPPTEIGAIEIVGTPDVPRAELLAELRVAPGVRYERDALDDRLARYVEARRKRGFYEAKVSHSVRLTGGDRVADLTLAVTPGPHVRVVFAGDPLPADQRDVLVPVEREGSADEDLLEDSSNRIEEFLRGQGYREASAPHERRESSGELLITFIVKKGRQYRVERVEVSGNASIPLAELAPNLRLVDGQPFGEARLDADLSTIEALYRRRGFASARAQASVEPREAGADPGGSVPVRVAIAIREGVRTLVGSVAIQGNRLVAEKPLREGLALLPGQPYFGAQLAADRDAIQLQYANLGYPNATVDAKPNFSADGTQADPVFTVHEGPRVFVDHVLIVGNVRTSTKTIERELQLQPGDPLGLAAKNESQRRLASLGLFRRTRIDELRHGDETTRDLMVTVEEAPATTVGVGGGGEVRLRVVRRAEDGGAAAERLEFAPRASFQIGRRNLWGKNRSVNFFTSVSVRLHPQDLPVDTSADGGYGFSEYRVLGTYREPRLFDTAADASITATLEQQTRSSFNFARRGAGIQVARRLTRQVSVTGNYQVQRTRLFDLSVRPEDQPLILRTFTHFLLSSFSSSLIRDTREDTLDPGAGHYASANVQLAARALGSEVGFAKSFFTAQAFRTLPYTNRIVFAANARLGLATGFPGDVVDTDPVTGTPVVKHNVRVVPESERFFAGGDTTNRGFALDTLGRPDTIINGFPIGGNGIVIVNAELRVPIWSVLGLVGFFDTGNVFQNASDIDLGALRSAVGFGARVKSPVGPIRIDLGFKMQRGEVVPGRREGLTALHVSFGQAF